MILHHVTIKSVLPAILRRGLRIRKSRGKLKAVWLATSALRAWALGHVGIERGYSLDRLAILTVRVPRAWLSRRRRGIWLCRRDVPADRIVSTSKVEVISAL